MKIKGQTLYLATCVVVETYHEEMTRKNITRIVWAEDEYEVRDKMEREYYRWCNEYGTQHIQHLEVTEAL